MGILLLGSHALPHTHLDMAITEKILHKGSIHAGHAGMMDGDAKG